MQNLQEKDIFDESPCVDQKKEWESPKNFDIAIYNKFFSESNQDNETVILEVRKDNNTVDYISYEKKISTNELVVLKFDQIKKTRKSTIIKSKIRIRYFNQDIDDVLVEITDAERDDFYSKYPTYDENAYKVLGIETLDGISFKYLVYRLNHNTLVFRNRCFYLPFDSSLVLWSKFNKVDEDLDLTVQNAYAQSLHGKESTLHSKYFSEAHSFDNNFKDYKIIGEEYLGYEVMSVIELDFRYNNESEEISEVKRRRLRGNFLV